MGRPQVGHSGVTRIVFAYAAALRTRDFAFERRTLSEWCHVEAARRARGLVGDLHLVARELDESLLAADRHGAALRDRTAIRAIRLERPGLHVVRPVDPEDVDEPRPEERILDGDHHLDAAMEVTRHPVRARDVDLVFARVREV